RSGDVLPEDERLTVAEADGGLVEGPGAHLRRVRERGRSEEALAYSRPEVLMSEAGDYGRGGPELVRVGLVVADDGTQMAEAGGDDDRVTPLSVERAG